MDEENKCDSNTAHCRHISFVSYSPRIGCGKPSCLRAGAAVQINTIAMQMILDTFTADSLKIIAECPLDDNTMASMHAVGRHCLLALENRQASAMHHRMREIAQLFGADSMRAQARA